jgi:hypothetical protein
MFTYQFYCPHTNRKEVTASYSSSAVSVRIRCRGDMFTYQFYCPHTNRKEVTASYSYSVVSVRIRCRGDMFTYPFYCAHTNLTQVTASYSSSTFSVRISCRGDMFTYPFYFYCNVRIRCRGNESSRMLRMTVSRRVYLGIKYPFGPSDNTSCAYTLQRDHVYRSVTMFCDVFTYPFSTLILGTKVP